MREPTVVAAAPKAFLEFAVARGADRDRLLRRACIHARDLADPNGRVPIVRYVAMMEAAIDLCREPALPLLYGEHVPTEDLSIVPFIAAHGASVDDIRTKVNRYAALMVDDGTDGPALETIPRGGKIWIRLVSALYARYPVLTESGVARTVCAVRTRLRSLGGRQTTLRFPDALHFTYPEPPHRKEYDRLFGVPMTFASDMNAIVVDPAFLSMPTPQPYGAAAAMVTEHAEQLLAQLTGPTSTRSSVEAALLRHLESGEVGMAEIARQLGLSRATLLRRLKAEGATFVEVLATVRKNRALQLLDNENRPVRETAQLLGFADAAAFSRAFKRWTGRSPKEIRRLHESGELCP